MRFLRPFLSTTSLYYQLITDARKKVNFPSVFLVELETPKGIVCDRYVE